jgi:hypothetical protein
VSASEPPEEEIERVKVNKLRTLGDVAPDREGAAAQHADAELSERARVLLQTEFDRALAMKEKLNAERAVGGKEKGRDVNRPDDKLRGVIASLEGANRFALKLGLITPAESREMYSAAMAKGLHDGGTR